MQKQALDAAQRARRSILARPPEQPATAKPAVPLDVPLDDEGLSAYADTEPMTFIDSRPFTAADTTPK